MARNELSPDAIEFAYGIGVEDYNALRVAVGWGELKPARARIGLANSVYVVAAVSEERVVGSARIVGDGGYVAYIADVMVLPEYQGRGIGTAMMERIMAHIKSLAEEGCEMFTCLMSAQGKEPFYEKFGFIERPCEGRGAGMAQFFTGNGKD